MRRLASSAAVLLLGCTPPSTDEPVPSGDSADTGADRFTVSGEVLDLEGAPVVDVFVTVSTEYCIPDRTDGAGGFTVDQVDAGDKRLITYGETASNGLFASVVFAFEADAAISFADPVLAPSLNETWPVDPEAAEDQVVTTSDGLELTIPAGSLTLAPFAPEELQVARVPTGQVPPFIPDGVELLDLFVLHPIQSTFDPPASVAFPGDLGLSEGTPVAFHALNYDTGELEPVASGAVDADGRPVTADGDGLRELTWVGVSLEDS